MMDTIVHVKRYDAPPVDRREILRYAMVSQPLEKLTELLESCLAEAEGVLSYHVCWREFPLAERSGVLDLGFAQTDSQTAERYLQNCGSVVLFAATVGLGLDRLLTRHSRLSPARALMLQAIGTERIEALCELFCGEMEKVHQTSRRFSPGYGDLPLALQRDIFRVLDCPKHIGLKLNESLLMSPTKSVTALIGIGNSCREGGCKDCGLKNCAYRGTI